MTEHAISLKQPWAALLVAGRKTIEVRRWPTSHRGRILIHAARIDDERPEARRHVSPDIEHLTRLRGGIIGAGTLTECRTYCTVEEFSADQAAHINDPEWFESAGLFGFVFADLEVLPYRRYPGWVRIFSVHDELPRRRPRSRRDP